MMNSVHRTAPNFIGIAGYSLMASLAMMACSSFQAASAQIAARPRLMVQSAGQTLLSFAFALSNDKQLLASAGDREGQVRIWEAATGRLLCTLDADLRSKTSGVSAGLAALTFSATNTELATAADDGSIRVWDLKHCGANKRVNLSPAQSEEAKSLSTLADGRVVLLAGDEQFYTANIFGDNGQLTAIDSNPAKALVAHTGDGKVLLARGKSPNAGMIAAQTLLQVHDIARGTVENIGDYKGAPAASGGGITDLLPPAAALSPSGRRVVALQSGRLSLYDRAARAVVAEVLLGNATENKDYTANVPVRAPTPAIDEKTRQQMESMLQMMPPEQRAKMQAQMDAMLRQAGAQSQAAAASMSGSTAAGLAAAATSWVGFSADEKSVLVWRSRDKDAGKSSSADTLRSAALEVRRLSDLKVERTLSFDDSLSSDALDALLSASFAQSSDRTVLVLGSANLAGGKIVLIDLSTTKPNLRAWTPSHGTVSSVAWTNNGQLITVHGNQLGGFESALDSRGGGALAGTPDITGGSAPEQPPTGLPTKGANSRFVRWDLTTGDTVSYPINSLMMGAPSALANLGGYASFFTVVPPTAARPRAEFQFQTIDINTLQVIHRGELFDDAGKPIASMPQGVALSPDGKLLAAIWPPERSGERLTREQRRNRPRARVVLHDVASGKPISEHDVRFRLRRETGAGSTLRFAADGRALFVMGDDEALVIELGNGKSREIPIKTASDLYGFAEGKSLRLITRDGRQRGEEATGGLSVLRIKRGDYSLAVSNPSGTVLAMATRRGTSVELHRIGNGTDDVQLLQGHTAPVAALAFSPDGRLLASSAEDGATLLWDLDKNTWIAQLHAFPDGTWAVVDPTGRFDTNNLENIEQLHWVLADDPLHARPLEIFMREYFEPRLLSRILSGATLPPTRDLAALNLAQPEVKITKIEPSTGNPQFVNVTVTVQQTQDRNGAASGVYDLRLSRDGRLVASSPQSTGQGPGAIKLDANGTARLRFENIRLPSKGGTITFSAYAFNRDQIKSRTDYATYAARAQKSSGRAYLISIGVNSHENAAWDLSFAANDARHIQQVVTQQLANLGGYGEVVAVPVIADQKSGRIATKETIRMLLSALAGRGDAGTLSAIPNADRLRAATPDDVVIVSFSGHGFTSPAGEFYLLPSDTGAGNSREVGSELTRKGISTNELAAWLQAIDAGDIAFVIDACQSAASVEKEGFKPGPMGSKGLGQLAYDKGIRILAASQADNFALEAAQLQHGLLTYALVDDGLVARRADYEPTDKRVALTEWLHFGVDRVPQLYTEIRAGKVQTVATSSGRGVSRVNAGVATSVAPTRSRVQEPRLFDFNRAPNDTLVAKF